MRALGLVLLMFAVLPGAVNAASDGSRYLKMDNEMYFLVKPTLHRELEVWNCVISSTDFNTRQGTTIEEMVTKTKGQFYSRRPRGVLRSSEHADLADKLRGILKQAPDEAKKAQEIFKIGAILKGPKTGYQEESVEMMLVMPASRTPTPEDASWVNLKDGQNENFFKVACPVEIPKASFPSELPPSDGSQYIKRHEGMYFLVKPTLATEFKVWDCFTSAASFNAWEGVTIGEVLDGTKGQLYNERLKGVLRTSRNTEQPAEFEPLVDQIRGAVSRLHSEEEAKSANHKFNQVYKIGAILKGQKISVSFQNNEKIRSVLDVPLEESVEMMLVMAASKKPSRGDRSWVILNDNGKNMKASFFKVACPD